MKPWSLMRVAAILQAIFALGHSAGGIPRKAIRGPQEQAIFDAMRNFRFEVMGTTRSHWDFYQGFGLSISVNMVILAVLMWQLGNLTRTNSEGARPMLMALLVGEVLNGVLSWKYFFAGPVVFSVLVTLCLAAALVTSSRQPVASQVVATG
jgi:hypothetical protein